MATARGSARKSTKKKNVQPAWRQSRIKKFAPIIAIMLVMGSFGVYKIIDTFASTGLVNSALHVGGGRFINESKTVHAHTVGYGKSSATPVFSFDGRKVLYYDRETNDATRGSLKLANSNDTDAQVVFTETAGDSFWHGSISWSRSGKYVGFVTYTNDSPESKYHIIDVTKAAPSTHTVIERDENGIYWSGPPVFSASNADTLYYFNQSSHADEINLCAYDAHVKAKLECQLIKHAYNLPQSFHTISVSGSKLYFIAMHMNNDATQAARNIFSVDTSTKSVDKLTSYEFEPYDYETYTPHRYLGDLTASPDGKHVLYRTTKSKEGQTNDSASYEEDRIVKLDVSSKAQSTFYDHLDEKNLYNNYHELTWQPHSFGSTRPPLPAQHNTEFEIGFEALPQPFTKGQVITPTINVKNSANLNRTNYAYKVYVRQNNDLTAEYPISIDLDGGESKQIQLKPVTIRSASYSTHLDSGLRVTIEPTGSQDQGYYDMTAGLPAPKFDVLGKNTRIVRKGAVVTIKGTTEKGRLVELRRNGTFLKTVTADRYGNFAFKYRIRKNQTLSANLWGFDGVAGMYEEIVFRVR